MPTRRDRARQAADLRADGLRLVDIASRMGLSVSYTWALLKDPDGSADRERKRSYGGVCDTCGGPTNGSNGRDAAATRCAKCSRWTREGIILAIQGWADEHGGVPPRGEDTRTSDVLPSLTVVIGHFDRWNDALRAAGFAPHMDRYPETTEAMVEAIRRGESTQTVADRYGISSSAVYQRLANHGISVGELRKGRAA